MIQEPPHNPEDTQPVVPPRTDPYRRVFAFLMVFSAVSLIVTVIYGITEFTGRPAQPTAEPVREVVLFVGGQEQRIVTRQDTVGDMLAEQGITIAPEDAISDPLSAILESDDVIYINRARDVSLTVDGVTRTLRTPLENPFDILEKAGIELEDGDRVRVDGTALEPEELLFWPLPAENIQIQKQVTFTVVDQSGEVTLTTSVETVGDALNEADITLYKADTVLPDLNTQLENDMIVEIIRAEPIFIQVDGHTIETRMQGGTVANALAEANIVLGGLDYTVPNENTDLTAGMSVRVVRVTEEVVTVDEPVTFETVYQASAEMELDTQAVTQAGVNGVRRISERVRYEDGVEVGREPAGEEIVTPPQNQVISYGTNIVLRTIDTPDGPREYWRKLRVYATSYHPAALGGDDVTSIGERLRKGIVAANPNIIPYRTNVFVPGYGTGFIADTGGARSSPYWIDLGYSDEDWVSWSRYVDIYLLTPVPGNIDYLLPDWRPLRGRAP